MLFDVPEWFLSPSFSPNRKKGKFWKKPPEQRWSYFTGKYFIIISFFHADEFSTTIATNLGKGTPASRCSNGGKWYDFLLFSHRRRIFLWSRRSVHTHTLEFTLGCFFALDRDRASSKINQSNVIFRRKRIFLHENDKKKSANNGESKKI